MTTGSWSIGNFTTGPYAASKVWSGADGKYESWQGGIRAKWNSYTLTHRVMSQVVNPPLNSYVSALPQYTLAQMKSNVGWTANDELRLLNKLAEQVRGHSFDLGVNVAEASKSYGTVVSNLRSVGSALWHLKHGRLGQASRVLGYGRSSQGILARRLNSKDLTGRWLETQYAFMPLISQSYEAAKALESLTKHRVLKFTATSSLRKVLDITSTTSYNTKCPMAYSKRLRAELSEDLSLQRSLGLVNPAEIAWEVVPYSFVVDWFLPVGSYIAAWGVIPYLVGRFMSTERGSLKRGVVVKGSNPNSTAWVNYAANRRKETLFRTLRTPSLSLSIPRPTFNKVPRALSPRRILSAVSLIHQRLR
jgi:hypothetical protein